MDEQPLPEAKAFGDDERSVLFGYLAYHRAVLARKLDGLSDDEARRATIPPSRMTLLGLIRHMTDVERWWFRRVFVATGAPPLFDEDEEWDVPDTATVADALGVYWAELAAVDQILAAADLDDISSGDPEGGRHTLRRTVVHLIEEYARHCGHADLLREQIDGRTGD